MASTTEFTLCDDFFYEYFIIRQGYLLTQKREMVVFATEYAVTPIYVSQAKQITLYNDGGVFSFEAYDMGSTDCLVFRLIGTPTTDLGYCEDVAKSENEDVYDADGNLVEVKRTLTEEDIKLLGGVFYKINLKDPEPFILRKIVAN